MFQFSSIYSSLWKAAILLEFVTEDQMENTTHSKAKMQDASANAIAGKVSKTSRSYTPEPDGDQHLGLPVCSQIFGSAVLQQEKFHFCFPFIDISRRNLWFYMGTLSRILEKILVKSQDWVQKLNLRFKFFEKISIWKKRKTNDSIRSYIYCLKKTRKKRAKLVKWQQPVCSQIFGSAVLQQEKFHLCFPTIDISSWNLRFYVGIFEKLLVKSYNWVQKLKLLVEFFEIKKMPVWQFEYLLFAKTQIKRAKLVKWQQRPKWRLPFCNTKDLFLNHVEKLVKPTLSSI